MRITQTVSTGDSHILLSLASSLLSQPASSIIALTELTSPALLGFDGLDPTSAARQGKARSVRVQGSTARRKILFGLRLLRCHSSSRSSRPCMVKGVFSCFLRSLHHIPQNMKHVSSVHSTPQPLLCSSASPSPSLSSSHRLSPSPFFFFLYPPYANNTK